MRKNVSYVCSLFFILSDQVTDLNLMVIHVNQNTLPVTFSQFNVIHLVIWNIKGTCGGPRCTIL